MSKNEKDLVKEFLARKGQEASGHCCDDAHCWHVKRGAIWMVVKDGHVIQECCHCPATRSIHAEHALEKYRSEGFKLEVQGSKTFPLPPHPNPRWKVWAGGPLPEGWTSDFERGREAQKFRC